MANVDIPNGFKPRRSDPQVSWHPVAASQTLVFGDPVLLDTAGRIIIAVENSSAALIGAMAGDSASAAVDTLVPVFDDPEEVFVAQFDGAPTRTAIYTTRASAACFDLKGSTGVFEINEAASSQDIVKVVGFPQSLPNGNDNDLTAANALGYIKFEKHWLRPQS